LGRAVALSDSAWARYCRAETERMLRCYSSGISGMYGVQLGGWVLPDEVHDSLALTTLFRCSLEQTCDDDLRGTFSRLPIESESLAAVLAPFALDGLTEPETVLEEIDRVLMPEGHVVLMATLPLTPWMGVVPGPLPGIARVMRYLGGRGYDITLRRRYLYRPPLGDQRWLERLAFMDRLGLGLAGAGLMVARKRVIGVTPAGVTLRMKTASARERAGVPAGLAGGGAR